MLTSDAAIVAKTWLLGGIPHKRHASASLALAAGESLKEVSARLGHSSIMVTADTYLAPPDSLARASTQRLAGVLDSAWQYPCDRPKRPAA